MTRFCTYIRMKATVFISQYSNIFKMGPKSGPFLFIFVLFLNTMTNIEKNDCKNITNRLSYGGPRCDLCFDCIFIHKLNNVPRINILSNAFAKKFDSLIFIHPFTSLCNFETFCKNAKLSYRFLGGGRQIILNCARFLSLSLSLSLSLIRLWKMRFGHLLESSLESHHKWLQ